MFLLDTDELSPFHSSFLSTPDGKYLPNPPPASPLPKAASSSSSSSSSSQRHQQPPSPSTSLLGVSSALKTHLHSRWPEDPAVPPCDSSLPPYPSAAAVGKSRRWRSIFPPPRLIACPRARPRSATLSFPKYRSDAVFPTIPSDGMQSCSDSSCGYGFSSFNSSPKDVSFDSESFGPKFRKAKHGKAFRLSVSGPARAHLGGASQAAKNMEDLDGIVHLIGEGEEGEKGRGGGQIEELREEEEQAERGTRHRKRIKYSNKI